MSPAGGGAARGEHTGNNKDSTERKFMLHMRVHNKKVFEVSVGRIRTILRVLLHGTARAKEGRQELEAMLPLTRAKGVGGRARERLRMP